MEDTDQNKLFIGGISWETTIDVLRDHFAKYGSVLSSIVAKDRITGNPRGFAFVAFSESSAVDRALLDSHQILSRTVEVKRAIPRGEQQGHQQHHRGFNMNNNSKINGSNRDQYRTKKIFVGGLSADLTDDEFRKYFEKFGRITDVVVMYDNTTHRPRGFGFITFDSEDSVEEVMQKNFHELTGKLVEVKRAVPKDANNSTNNGYNGRVVAGERSPKFNSYPQGSNSPYNNASFGYVPFGYGNVPMYPYGAGFYGYGLGPMAPRGPPWSPAMVGMRGGLFPYGGGAPVYPAYINGGPSVMGLAANGYSGILGNGDAQSAGESTQTARDGMIVNSYGYGRGTGAAAGSKQNQNSYNKSYPTYSSS